MNWFFWRKQPVEWVILPHDIHWPGFETSFIIEDSWEPYGVTPVPNTLDVNQIRLWTRRPRKFKKRKSYEIKIQQGGWGGHQVLLHLSSGWKPFAVSDSSGNHIIWFYK